MGRIGLATPVYVLGVMIASHFMGHMPADSLLILGTSFCLWVDLAIKK